MSERIIHEHASSASKSLPDICADLEFVGDAKVRVRGHEQAVRPIPGQFVTQSPGYPDAVGSIGQYLYNSYYIQPSGGRGGYRQVDDKLLREKWATRVLNANASDGSWVSGWRVVEEGDGVVKLVDKNGRTLQVSRERFRATGDAAQVRFDRLATVAQVGWVHVRGDIDHATETTRTLRFYWNLSAPGTIPFVHETTSAFKNSGIPVHLKVMEDPDKFRRADAGVIYVPTASWDGIAPRIERIHQAIGRYLKSSTPLFTKRLAPGLALAEDPGNGESFGSDRCRIVSEGLWDAYVAGATSAEARLAAVEARFRSRGLDPARPHLNAGTTGDFELSLRPIAVPKLEREIVV